MCIRKRIKIDPHLASAIGSLSFSSVDPRVLKSGDVNTWQCFSIHSAGNASSVIVVLLEVEVVVEGGVTLFFLTGKCKNNYQPLAPGPRRRANN